MNLPDDYKENYILSNEQVKEKCCFYNCQEYKVMQYKCLKCNYKYCDIYCIRKDYPIHNCKN